MHKLVLKKDNLAQQQMSALRQLHGRTVQRTPIAGHVRTARIFSHKVYSVTSAPNTALITTARLKLAGSRLPVLEESLHIGERARAALLSKARELLGQAKIPPQLSGHGIAKDKHHSHAFYLPEDADNDGIIDHLVVHANYGLCSESHMISPSIPAVTKNFVRSGLRSIKSSTILINLIIIFPISYSL